MLELTREAGFDLVGLAPFAPPHRADEFRSWLALGRHGDMDYLAEFGPRITDPPAHLPWGRTVLVVGLGHSRPPVRSTDGARIARYAAGRDYHNVVGKRLKLLARDLRRAGLVREFKKVVDAGPLMERAHAARAGLGFESKAANLLHPRFGPWFFLGELVLDVELEPTEAVPAGSCGTCTACIDACPTGAIVAPGEVDARACISYLTIEQKGPNDRALRAAAGDWLFGCDVCSEVCPWGQRAPDLTERFGTHAAVGELDVLDWLRAPERLEADLAGSPLQRAGVDGLLRNAIQFVGRHPRDEAGPLLAQRLATAEAPLVRDAAAWALASAHGADASTRIALERQWEREPEAWVRRGIELELERLER